MNRVLFGLMLAVSLVGCGDNEPAEQSQVDAGRDATGCVLQSTVHYSGPTDQLGDASATVACPRQ